MEGPSEDSLITFKRRTKIVIGGRYREATSWEMEGGGEWMRYGKTQSERTKGSGD
jgi:hypothetical protein